MPDREFFHCDTEEVEPGVVECSLVRYIRRDLPFRPDVDEPVEVLARRRFRKGNRMAIWGYERELSRAADEARAGRYGATVSVVPLPDGKVKVEVVECAFDGLKLRTDVLASGRFDATDEDALVPTAEAMAELRAWVEERNRRRVKQMVEAEAREAVDAEIATRHAQDRARAAKELAEILERAGR